MRSVRVVLTLTVLATVLASGFAGVAAADSQAGTGVAVDTAAEASPDGTTFASAQSDSAGFSGQNPYVSVSGSGSAGGGSAVAVGLDSSV